jgi:GNAT superfamily N-acetyltransferase
MTGIVGLRRATAADIAAVTTLQHRAYAKNRVTLGVEPLPLMADYADVFAAFEVWVAEGPDGLQGVFILEPRSDDLLLWSVATAPEVQGRGLGNRLLAATEARATELGLNIVRLYTGEKLVNNVAWYERHGYVRERVEDIKGRRVIHMMKNLNVVSRP